MYLQPNAHAQWFQVLSDLQKETRVSLPAEIEHYLLMTLLYHTEQTSLLEACLSEHFFEALEGRFVPAKWQEIGDKCLIISGIFPQWSQRRVRSEKFLHQMGKLGYRQASLQYFGAEKKIFSYLHEHFEPVTELLHQLDCSEQELSTHHFFSNRRPHLM